MAIRNIVKEGDPILNKVCRPVTNFDDRLATVLRSRADGPVSSRIQFRQLLDLLGTLPGYAAADSGEVQALHRLLPWWNFNHKKGSARP